MSWCDKLASVPSAGFKFNPVVASGSSLLDSIAPVLNRLPTGKEMKLTVSKMDSVSVEVVTDEGFSYGLDGQRIYVDFKHRLKVKHQSAGLPTVEFLSKSAPYTSLLKEVAKKLLDVAACAIDPDTRQVLTIGIVATTIVSEDDAPPGVRRFIERVTSPWKGPAEHFKFSIATEVATSPGGRDVCIHNVEKPEHGEGLLTVTFDWQRTLLSGQRKPSNVFLSEQMEIARTEALKYFEEIGEGYRFDGPNNA